MALMAASASVSTGSVTGTTLTAIKHTISGHRLISHVRHWSPINYQLRLRARSFSSVCPPITPGMRTNAAATESAGAVAADASVEKVESPAVIVTGASRGIGRAIALSLGKAGCKVRKTFE